MIKLVTIILIIACIVGWLIGSVGIVAMLYFCVEGEVAIGIAIAILSIFVCFNAFRWSIELYDIFHKKEKVGV